MLSFFLQELKLIATSMTEAITVNFKVVLMVDSSIVNEFKFHYNDPAPGYSLKNTDLLIL